MADERVYVVGLTELRGELRAMDKTFARVITKAGKTAATVVAKEAREYAIFIGGVAGHVADTVKAGASTSTAFITGGGAEHPEFWGAEFGGGKYGPSRPSPRGGHTTQFKQWRGSGASAGYFMYPAVRKKKTEAVEIYGTELDRELAVIASGSTR